MTNRKRKQRALPKPDDNLAPEQFPELNHQFYRAALPPSDYLSHRYRSLFLAAQPPDKLPAAFGQELTIGELRATWTSTDEFQTDEMRDYVSTESTVLLHHTTEALFRLYFAHADRTECPWLGVAGLRLPADFKNRMSKFMKEAGAESTRESAMLVFYGAKTVSPEQVEQWKKYTDSLMSLLRHLGRRLLDEAPLYNSAKHGLSLVPGAAAMQLGDQTGPLRIRADGPSITHLTVRNGKEGKRWAQETVWLSAEQNLALVVLAVRLIENLWYVARCRYVSEKWDRTKLHFLGPDLVSGVLHPETVGNEVRITVPSMSMDLLYYEPEKSKAQQPHQKR